MVVSLAVAAWALGAGDVVLGDDTHPVSADNRAHRDRHRAHHGWGESAAHWASGAADAGLEGREDPQVAAYERSWERFGDAGAGPAPDFAPTTHLGVVQSVEGAAPVSPGARCEVRLLPVLSSLFNCVVRVACDDVVLYPDPAQEAGYAPCSVESGVVLGALDDGSTHEDGDPSVEVDVTNRSVQVGDRGPAVEPFWARIGLIRSI